MKALLLAAGFGIRLRPLTNNTPKCLVPIKGQPLLDIWLEELSGAGVEQFLVNTHYLHEKVEAYIKDCKYTESIEMVYEPELLGTAGTLRANRDFFGGGDGLLVHADNYCLADFSGFISAHRNRPKQCVMTMMTFHTENPSSCGIVELDASGVVEAFYEKQANPPGTLANGAVYILSADLIKSISESKYTDFSTEILPDLIGRIFCFENKNIHIDIGSPDAYAKAQLV